MLVPLKGYDEPEILTYSSSPICLAVADGGQWYLTGPISSPIVLGDLNTMLHVSAGDILGADS